MDVLRMQTSYPGNGEQIGAKYQLRYAAGLYWLIDMKQSGAGYISPVPLNESGAKLWRMIEDGIPQTEICRQLCEEYEISMEEARGDLQDFVRQLQTMRVDLEVLI